MNLELFPKSQPTLGLQKGELCCAQLHSGESLGTYSPKLSGGQKLFRGAGAGGLVSPKALYWSWLGDS